MNPRILLVDDEPVFLDALTRKLRMLGHRDVTAVSDPLKARDLVERQCFDLALLDVIMPGMDGLKLLEHITSQCPATRAIMITAVGSVDTAVRAMRLGAYDYLLKPLDPERLAGTVSRALSDLQMYEFQARRARGGDELEQPEAFSEVVTCDQAMQRILKEAELHAQSPIPVLILGETGVGKELLARAIHKASRRAQGPFVAVNMLALSAGLFESEFFGHKKGAFTGAVADKNGYLSLAKGGTLFLDEIGDLPMEIQGKLLRILQEGEYCAVGSTTVQRADVRFVAATNQDLDRQVEEGRFRRDLYYRLRFARLEIPPLRERPDDIRLLARHLVGGYLGQDRPALQDAVMQRLLTHSWPGNVRELKGTLEAACNLSAGKPLLVRHLQLPPEEDAAALDPATRELLTPLSEVERQYILKVYQLTDRNKSQAARVLGISFKTLLRKLKSYDLD